MLYYVLKENRQNHSQSVGGQFLSHLKLASALTIPALNEWKLAMR